MLRRWTALTFTVNEQTERQNALRSFMNKRMLHMFHTVFAEDFG